VVAKALLEAGETVRVVVRDAAKGAVWKEKGAEVAVADVADAKALQAAFQGADGVYLVVPPNYASNTVLADQRRVVDAYAAALEAVRPKHVVLLSSVGAQHERGTGPIQLLHYAEQRLQRLDGVALTALRAAYFQENWAGVLPLAKAEGILPAMLQPGKKLPMVATEDIGRIAAEALRQGPSAAGVIELAGPVDYETAEVAAAASKSLGKPVQRIDVPAEGIVPALQQAGLTADMAGLYREMIGALNDGKVTWAGTPRRGRVALEETIAKLLQ
jgi:uncharacterized protein YbjT (DUF2867 family)